MSTQASQPNENKSGYDDIIIEGHSYDGIQEYDNPMPKWWLWIFYITIIWSGLYVVGISFGYINTYEDDLAKETRHIDELRFAAQQDSPDITPEYLAGILGDEAMLGTGAQVYNSTCASCHGVKGEGGIGANLADDHWIHGGSAPEIFDIIDQGVLAKGMPAWGNILSPNEMVALVVFIDSIRSTHPEGGKQAEGELYEEQ